MNLQFFLNVIEFGMDLQDAIDAPASAPGVIGFEGRFPAPGRCRKKICADGPSRPPLSYIALERDGERPENAGERGAR